MAYMKGSIGERNPRRAVVLIIVLAVLTLLALLAVIFTRLSTIERSTSRAYADLVRARMHAQSGIFFAIAQTRNLLSDQGFTNDFIYYGEDLNGNKQFDGGVEDQDGDNILQTYNCPLRRAVRPSFMKNLNEDKDTNGNDILDEKDLIEIKGRKVGVSGFVLGTYKPEGDFYAVRVEDLSSRIHVNMENPYMETILENLAEATGLDRSIGSKIYQNRPYFIINELQSKAGLNKKEFEIMKQLLTVYAWLNKRVVEPVPLNARLGKPKLGQYIYTWEEIRPRQIDYPRASLKTAQGYIGTKKGEIVGRAPVNINTAPKEVLIALLQGLKGFYLNERETLKPMGNRYDILDKKYSYTDFEDPANGVYRGSLGKLKETPEINRDLARKIADSIIANREIEESDKQFDWEGPFRSWEQFRLLCDKVLWAAEGQGGILTAQQADVLKANFNPNSNINDFNPDFHRMFWVDKTDLTYHTTEFTFFPTGYFSIDSIGRVLGKAIEVAGYANGGSKVMAEAEINTVVKLFEIYQETTQQDFLYEYWKNNVVIKDNIIRANPDPGFYPTTDDLTLQTYPEILEKAYIKDARYDGYISLATGEHHPPNAQFIAHYSKKNRLSKNFDADTGQNQVLDTKGPYVNRLVLSGEEDSGYVSGAGTWKPGKLFPDGVYSEIDSVPMCNYRPADYDIFTVSLWIKPHFFPESAAKTRVYLTFQSTVSLKGKGVAPMGLYNIANAKGIVKKQKVLLKKPGKGTIVYYYEYGGSMEDGSKDGYLYNNDPWDNASFLAGGCSPKRGQYGAWEGGIATPCLNHLTHDHDDITRCGRKWPTLLRAGKWVHIAWIHDVRQDKIAPYGGLVGDEDKVAFYDIDALFVNGIECSGLLGAGLNDVDKIEPNYNLPGNILRLGERKKASKLNSAPDSTLDEVILWEGLTMPQAEQEVLRVYQEGRYYREDDLSKCGVFTSRPIDLAKEAGFPAGTPVTLFLAAWTQYRPDTLPADATCEVTIVSAGKQTLNEPRFLQNPPGSLIKAYAGGPLTVTKPIRYQVFFRPKTGLNDPVVDSLIFDDITLIYYSKPQFKSWLYVQ